jgi:hypothetical protein
MRPAHLLLVAVAVFACGGSDRDPARDAGARLDAAPDGASADAPDSGTSPRAIYRIRSDAAAPFFDMPFPNDARRTPAGTIDLAGFPNPTGVPIIEAYAGAIMAELRGFGTQSAIYFRFSHPVDAAPLPATPDASIAAGASVFLLDVTPGSPERGVPHPVHIHYQDEATQFWAAHTLAIRPIYGAPLASGRQYAAVVTRAVTPRDGGTFARDDDFEALAAAAPLGELGVLAAAGVPLDDVLVATVFTTQDATGETAAVRDWMLAELAPPTVRGPITTLASSPDLTEVTGRYGPVPIFQEGAIPYASGGGALRLDASGAPTVHGEYDARFTLTVPTSPMPGAGYPIVLYAHGTGGDYRTIVTDGLASMLAAAGFAAMGIDQIHHGERNPGGGDPSALVFNFANPYAARDNQRQSALDIVQQTRVIAALTFDRGGETVRFDASRVAFLGHSQGAWSGPIALGIHDVIHAAVLSAPPGTFGPAFLFRLDPVPVPDLVRAILGLPGATWEEAYELEGFTFEHPFVTLVQTWLEAAEPANYGRWIARTPREGHAPKSVLIVEGMLDRFVPPLAVEALAGAIGTPQIEPVHSPVDALRLAGVPTLPPPVYRNYGGGAATGGLLQFSDAGHFALTGDPAAMAQVRGFFESLASEGPPGTIPAPPP